ncbi:hypothetical protein J7E24_15750 [Hymenobacter sp. ISL-91]|uniref:hypothetical protein n=1 Tax=Hymenobacter sp. ISL-91 TaxID=2819151 RepID=UPI001BE8DCAD|nr:hypothetical protein [Hymenobacter sp. ISL-91]MBT2559243.1 hypothetical protein [Hymenobacter sp. ISL-91]
MPVPFDSSFLHDATLVSLELAWGDGEVIFYLRTGNNPDFRLTVREVTAVTATRNFEWGPSGSVNTVTVSEQAVIVEMQSGDTITITGRFKAQV